MAEAAPHGTVRGAARAPGRLDALTGVRALAALWVVLGHYRGTIEAAVPVLEHLDRFFALGYLGVDLFFVLSGFILTHNYVGRFAGGVTRASYRRFLVLRLARIYPVHLLTLNVQLVLLAGAAVLGQTLDNAGPGAFGAPQYVANLLLVHAWFSDQLSWNGPAWTISAEWFAYLLFPFAAVLVARFRGVALALAGAALAYGVLALLFGTVFSGSTTTAYAALPRIACEFAAGCLLHRAWAAAPGRRWIGWLSLPAGAVLVALPWIASLPIEDYSRGIMWGFVCGILVLSLAYDQGPVAYLLRSRFALYWGAASYSLYMTHVVVQQVVNKALDHDRVLATHGTAFRLVAIAAVTIAVLGTAAATYRFVERPARERLRRVAGPG